MFFINALGKIEIYEDRMGNFDLKKVQFIQFNCDVQPMIFV